MLLVLQRCLSACLLSSDAKDTEIAELKKQLAEEDAELLAAQAEMPKLRDPAKGAELEKEQPDASRPRMMKDAHEDAQKQLKAALSARDTEEININGPTKIKTSDGVEWTVTCRHEWGEDDRDEWHVAARAGDAKPVVFVIMGSLPD